MRVRCIGGRHGLRDGLKFNLLKRVVYTPDVRILIYLDLLGDISIVGSCFEGSFALVCRPSWCLVLWFMHMVVKPIVLHLFFRVVILTHPKSLLTHSIKNFTL